MIIGYPYHPSSFVVIDRVSVMIAPPPRYLWTLFVPQNDSYIPRNQSPTRGICPSSLNARMATFASSSADARSKNIYHDSNSCTSS